MKLNTNKGIKCITDSLQLQYKLMLDKNESIILNIQTAS